MMFLVYVVLSLFDLSLIGFVHRVEFRYIKIEYCSSSNESVAIFEDCLISTAEKAVNMTLNLKKSIEKYDVRKKISIDFCSNILFTLANVLTGSFITVSDVN